MEFITFTPEDLTMLKSKDETLGKTMDLVKPRPRVLHPDLFENMVRQMVSQQISLKSAETVWKRFEKQYTTITPAHILEKPREEMSSLGISPTKAQWIYEAAGKFQNDPTFYQLLRRKSNEEIKNHLLTFRGVGPWTVDMLLIFTLRRKDILSYEDLGVRLGLMKLYGLDKISKKEFKTYQDRFSPLGTLASLYFWAIYAKDFPLEKLM